MTKTEFCVLKLTYLIDPLYCMYYEQATSEVLFTTAEPCCKHGALEQGYFQVLLISSLCSHTNWVNIGPMIFESGL